MRLILSLSTALLCFSSLPAQTQNIAYYPDNLLSGGRNAFPWGSVGIRYQVIVPASVLGSRPHVIQDIMVSGDPSAGPTEIVWDDIEIRMGTTAQATLTSNWATNNPNPTTVYRGPLRVRFNPTRWQGIGLPQSYLYVPRTPAVNLCVEIIGWKIQGRSSGNFYYPYNDSATRRAFRYQWTTNQSQAALTGGGASKMGLVLGSGNFVTVGTGCQSSSNTALEIGSNTFPQAGKPIDITLSGARALLPVVLMLGADFQKLGPITLPFDLAPLGAKGCFVWNDILLPLPSVADASGAAKVTLPIPSSTGNIRVYVHWWQRDPQANAFGWTTSSSGKMLLGN